MIVDADLQFIGKLMAAEDFAAASTRLIGLLRVRFESRLDCHAFLTRLPPPHIEADPILCRAHGLNCLDHGRQVEARDWVRRAEGLADADGKVDCQLDLALIAREANQWREAEAILGEVVPRHPGQELRLLNQVAICQLMYRRDLNAAAGTFLRIETMALESGDRYEYLRAVINRGLSVERARGRFDRMRDCAAAINRHYGGEPPLEDEIYQVRLLAEASFGDRDPACPSFCARLIELSERGGRSNPHAAGYGHALLAFDRSLSGDHHQAAGLAEAALARSLPNCATVALSLAVRARCQAALGQMVTARATLEEALTHSCPEDRAPTVILERANLEFDAGAFQEALAFARMASERAASVGAEWDWLRAEFLCLAIHFSPSRAIELVNMAVDKGILISLVKRDPSPMSMALTRCLELSVRPHIAATAGLESGFIVRVFGGCDVWGTGGKIARSAWTRPKARSLFFYLVWRSSANGVAVDDILDDLWSGAEYSEALNAFRVACTYVRRVIGPDSIVVRDGLLRMHLPRGSWVDLFAVREAVDSRNPAHAKRVLAELSGPSAFREINELWAESARSEADDLWATLCGRIDP